MSNEDEQRRETEAREGATEAPAEAGAARPYDGAPVGEGAAPADVGSTQSGRPAYGAVRYTRRRVLILGGALVAGVGAVFAGIKTFGGSAAEKVGGAISDQFGAFPVRSVEDVPDVPPEQWVVTIDGLVDNPLTVDRIAWNGLQRKNQTVDFHCVEGWSVDDVRWGGVAPAVLLDQAGVRPEAQYAVFHAHGGVYLSTLPLDLVRDEQTMLADAMNGAPLPPKHGGPLRLVVPKQLGYKNVKWVERIELTTQVKTGYWESNGYPEDAPIAGG